MGPDSRIYSDRLRVHALSRFSHRLNVYPAHVHNEAKIGIAEARKRQADVEIEKEEMKSVIEIASNDQGTLKEAEAEAQNKEAAKKLTNIDTIKENIKTLVNNIVLEAAKQLMKKNDDKDTLLETSGSNDVENSDQLTTIRRSSRQRKKTSKGEQAQLSHKPKRSVHTSEYRETEVSWTCPKYKKKVTTKQGGVVCEACVAYWHFECTDVSKESIQKMAAEEDFFCSIHRRNQNIDTQLEENEPTCFNDAEMEIIKTNQPNNTTDKDNETCCVNKPTSNDGPKGDNERIGTETKLVKKKMEEIDQLKEDIKQQNIAHQIKLDLNQKTLDSIASQNCGMKKEKSQLQQEIRRLSNENTVLENKNKELEIKNRELKADNDAHIEFAKEAFLSDPSSSEKFVKMEEQINQLRCENQEKDKQISEMRTSIPQQDPKITAKNKEIQSLKSQISALEVRTSELQDSEQQCRRELNVKIADYQREKDINTLLLQNKSQPAQPEISSEPRDENGGQAPSHTRAPTTSRIEKKSARRLCCYEVLEKDSCPYQNRCMFNHLVSDENRDDISITNEAREKNHRYTGTLGHAEMEKTHRRITAKKRFSTALDHALLSAQRCTG